MKSMGKLRTIAGAIRKLIADKEDTKQVFVILEALGGRSAERSYKRFLKTPHADKILNADKKLIDYLRDRDWLAAQPEGSLAHTYHKFTAVEQITADGLVQASEDGIDRYDDISESQCVYQNRQRDSHDLWHVVTGYGRDPLGELSLLAVTWRQVGNIGFLLIIAVGYRVMGKEAPELKIGAALREGFRRGKKGAWLPAADWETLLTRPLEKVRTELGFDKPLAYRAIVDNTEELQTAGLAVAAE